MKHLAPFLIGAMSVMLLLFVWVAGRKTIQRSFANWIGTHAVNAGVQQQPSSGAISAQNVAGALVADNFPGGDIGEKINNAIAALPKFASDGKPYGTVVLNLSTMPFQQATTIVKPVRVMLDCNGGTLNYVGNGGAAIAIASTKGSLGLYADGGLRNCVIERGGVSANGVWARNRTTGLFFGGDPAGLIAPRDANGYRQNIYNVRVMGFMYGMQLGNHAYMLSFTDCAFVHNGINIADNITTTIDSGENINFKGGRVTGSTEGANIQLDNSTYEWRFFGTSIDYPKTASIVGSAVNFQCFGCHFEQFNGPFIYASGKVGHQIVIDGGTVMITGKSGVEPSLFKIAGNGSRVILNGVNYYFVHPVTAFVDNSGDRASVVSMPTFTMQLGTEPPAFTTGANGPSHPDGFFSYQLGKRGNSEFSWSGVPPGGVHLTPGADSNRDVFYVSNAANNGVAFGINGDGSVHGSVLESTAQTGTPPLVVNSQTPVANLTLLNPSQLPRGTVPLKGQTGVVGGQRLNAGACLSSVAGGFTGLTSSMVFMATPATYPGDGIWWGAYYGSPTTVNVKVCSLSATTPAASSYNVRVIP